jgi:segregation and condensation protein B
MDVPNGAQQGPIDARSGDAGWTCDEIDRLYRQALETVADVAQDLNAARQEIDQGADVHSAADVSDTGDIFGQDERPAADLSENAVPPVDDSAAEGGQPLGPSQVIEAMLFVGEKPLTTKIICGALRGEFDAGFVDETIEELNQQYSRQNRPYEIRLADGGYRLVLRPEFEAIRNRVYGFGPKQIRLSQETLEVLALVAYRQPVSRPAIEEIAKRGAGSHLRQLLQRELVILDRTEGNQDRDVRYRTSPRFLQLFGLARLDDLPQIEDLNFK